MRKLKKKAKHGGRNSTRSTRLVSSDSVFYSMRAEQRSEHQTDLTFCTSSWKENQKEGKTELGNMNETFPWGLAQDQGKRSYMEDRTCCKIQKYDRREEEEKDVQSKASMDNVERQNKSEVGRESERVRTHQNFFAVFDGHGGDSIAEYLSQKLYKLVFEDSRYFTQPDQVLKDCFKQVDRDYFNAGGGGNPTHICGSTGLACTIVERMLYAAWVGDTSQILSRYYLYLLHAPLFSAATTRSLPK